MMYSKEQLSQLLEKVNKQIENDNDIIKGYLFGSYSKGQQTNDSDIDFGFVIRDGINVKRKAADIKYALYKNNLLKNRTDIICLNESFVPNDLLLIENQILNEGIKFYG